METTLNFDYSENRGKSVSVTCKEGRHRYVMVDPCNSNFVFTEKDEDTTWGILIGICPDHTVILDIKHPSGIPCICEIDRDDIEEIALVESQETADYLYPNPQN